MKEVWKHIESNSDYQISSFGRVKSFKRKTPAILKPIKDNRGYYVVNLSSGGKMSQELIHRLVATHFISNPDDLPQVNHRDLDKLNNLVSNLEWCGARENVSHYYKSVTSLPTGVSNEVGKFRAKIHAGGETYCLGLHESAKKASEVYEKALKIFTESGKEELLKYQHNVRDNYTSKYKGVCYDKSRGKWMATVYFEGKYRLRKRFDEEKDALKAVIDKYVELGIPLHYSHTI